MWYTVYSINIHGTLHLLLHLFLHLNLGVLLVGGVQDAHCLEVESAYTPHEDLLQVVLHEVLVPIGDSLLSLGVIEL